MLRRTLRLRRQYLYQRQQSQNEALLRQKRKALKDSLEKDRPLPSEIRDDIQLRKDYRFDEGLDQQDTQVLDDEYGDLGEKEPNVLITTSRKPSTRLQQFTKEMRLLIPNSRRMNRGNLVIEDIVSACRSTGVTDLIILHETRGTPDCVIISHFPYGPTASFTLHNALFPPNPKENSSRVITFANQRDYISLRHHVYLRIDTKNIELVEVGPRFEMRLYEIKLGTIESSTAEIEWRLKPYQRHKSFVLSEA
ncbi:hypothetical protein MERGE_001656 [Pneumocystis wakefieldiae]|uniref:U3 small nucleolar ribonucleoprotein protein IMP4 n=1 Tax=Pneumocystis wakefieldiae TaxID=38082 RepID=A0A899FVI2_9ASCO|nr:hypothetical protein MERGE_001656 [Pneumocystis wakefieldiae]